MRLISSLQIFFGALILSGCVTTSQNQPYQPSAQEIANSAAIEKARKKCGVAEVGMSEKAKEKIYSCIKNSYREESGTSTTISANTATSSCGFMEEFFGERDCRQEQIDNALNVCETRKTWIETAECKADVITSYRNDPFTQEIAAYTRLLIEKVKARKMTSAEAEYAIQQKVAEVNQRIAGIKTESRRLDLIERDQDLRAHQERMKNMNETTQHNNDQMMEVLKRNQQTPTPTINNPERTECHPSFGGGFECTTYK